MNSILYLNGEYMPLSEGRLPITERGFQFGDGVYEAIRVYNGVPFALREHLERMINSLALIDMEPPLNIERMAKICNEVVERSGEKECSIYGQITRGVAKRIHRFPDAETPATVLFYAMPIVNYDEQKRRKGVKTVSHTDIRWDMCNIKSISLLPNVLLKNKALKMGVFETILYDDNGLVSEGAVCNAFCIKDDTLYTAPDGNRVLPGITKMIVLQEAPRVGLKVVEDAQTIGFFKAADEVFLTSTTMEIMPVVEIDDVKLSAGEAGPWMWKLHEAYQKRITRECR